MKWTFGDDFGIFSVFSAELGSTAETCTASLYIRLEIFTEFLSEGGLGPLRSASACGVDTPVVAQMRLLMVFQTIEIPQLHVGHGDRCPWCVRVQRVPRVSSWRRQSSSHAVALAERNSSFGAAHLRVDELMG